LYIPLKKVFDLFLFSSVFIALCAVAMVHQTNRLFHLDYKWVNYIWFVFYSTLASYNFHWYLTPESISEIERSAWSVGHKKLHVFLIFTGMTGAAYHISFFLHHWLALGVAAILTFLYSAPKIPHPLFGHLKKIAVGKTFYLSFVWLYVTTILPFIFSHTAFSAPELFFCLGRFFLIYGICILFDYRDRENDRREGLRSIITYVTDRQVSFIFYFSLFAFACFTLVLAWYRFSPLLTALLLFPFPVLIYIYPRSRNNFSDYLYYFVLDGLMAVSSFFTLFISI